MVVATLPWLALPLRGQDATRAADTPADASAGGAAADAPGASAPESAPSAGSPIYYNQTNPPPAYGEPGFGIVQRVPSSELGAPEYGVPYSALPLSPDPFAARSFGVGETTYSHWDGGSGSINLGSAGISLSRLPGIIQHGVAPDNALLKLGPLYFYLRSVDAYMFYTDNSRLTETNRQSEVAAIITMDMLLIAQVTDDLELSVAGTLVYLPVQNILSLNYSGLPGGSLGYLLEAAPTLAASVTQGANIAGWPVQFRDGFSTSTGRYSDSTLDSFTLFQGSSAQQNFNNGAYTFHSSHANLRNTSEVNNTSANDSYFTFFANTVSATTFKDLPNDITLTAAANHSDIWYYNQGNRGLPTSRDAFFAEAQDVRPSLRFKPFVTYEVTYSSNVPGVFQTVAAGLSGPITGQLFLSTDVGYYLSNTGHQGLLWVLDLAHTAGVYTTENFQIRRDLSDFNDEVTTTEYYRLNQILGPTLNGALFASHSDFQELSGNGTVDRSQEDFGIDITWVVGPLTHLSMGTTYAHQDFADDFVTDTLSARVSLSRTFSDSLFLRAFYQYQRFLTNQPGHNYFENLVYVSMQKYF